MYWIIQLNPLLTATILFSFGRFIGHGGCNLIVLLAVSFMVICALFSLVDVVLLRNVIYTDIGHWLDSEVLGVRCGQIIDSFSSVMLFVVTGISLVVYIYSMDYMSSDPFFLGLSIFASSCLIRHSSFYFFGFLIILWFLFLLLWIVYFLASNTAIVGLQRIPGKLLFLVHDSFLGLSSLVYLLSLASLLMLPADIFLVYQYWKKAFLCIIIFLVSADKTIILASLQSDQPERMNSRLTAGSISAEAVTAGVSLIYRCSMILEYCPLILCLLALIGAHTAFLAASSSLVKNDLKKIIALSTCSQLGYMVWACGFSLYSHSFCHLVNHAFFKALLFLSAGSLIHAMKNEQDLRKMGGAISYLPMTYIAMLLASLSLSGIPFFTGFYSKDNLLEVAASQYRYWAGRSYYWSKLAPLESFILGLINRSRMILRRRFEIADIGQAGHIHFLSFGWIKPCAGGFDILLWIFLIGLAGLNSDTGFIE